jgi:hypothetical protein
LRGAERRGNLDPQEAPLPEILRFARNDSVRHKEEN